MTVEGDAPTWGGMVSALLGALGQKEPFQERRAKVAELLGQMGACPAAISRVKRSKQSLSALSDLLNKRRYDGSLLTLRLSDVAGCPGAKIGDDDKVVPCRKADCAWRAQPIAAPADAPLFAPRPSLGEPAPLAELPIELTSYIVRLVAYDWSALAALRATCRALRMVVDRVLPSILIDCDLVILNPARTWQLAPVNLMHNASRLWMVRARVPSPVTQLRWHAVEPEAGRFIARPGLAIATLRKVATLQQWHDALVHLHWGGHYRPTYGVIMAPFPTDDAPAKARALYERVHALQQRYGVNVLERNNRSALDWFLRLTECMPVAEAIIDQALADLRVRQPLLFTDATCAARRQVFCQIILRAPRTDTAAAVVEAAARFCVRLSQIEIEEIERMVADEGIPLIMLVTHDDILDNFKDVRYNANAADTLEFYEGSTVYRCSQVIRKYRTSVALPRDLPLIVADMTALGLPAAAVEAAARRMPDCLVAADFAERALAARKSDGYRAHLLPALWAQFGPALTCLAQRP